MHINIHAHSDKSNPIGRIGDKFSKISVFSPSTQSSGIIKKYYNLNMIKKLVIKRTPIVIINFF